MEPRDAEREQFIAAELASARARWRAGDFLTLDEPDVPVGSFTAYLDGARRLAEMLWERHQARERRRARRTRSLDSLLEEPADPRDHVAELVVADLTSAMMRILTDHQRRVLEISEGRTYAEISEMMGISEIAVKRALERARAVIRGTFAD